MKALFLDRDGVINVDYNFVHKQENFDFVPGIFELVKQAKRAGYYVFVVTNQSGIARGLYSEDQFLSLSRWMCDEFERRGGLIDHVFYCPHHPKFSVGADANCDCRKPKPGMFLQAQALYNVTFHNSVMVGDKVSDIEAAIAAGINKHFFYHDKDASIPESEVLDRACKFTHLKSVVDWFTAQ